MLRKAHKKRPNKPIQPNLLNKNDTESLRLQFYNRFTRIIKRVILKLLLKLAKFLPSQLFLKGF